MTRKERFSKSTRVSLERRRFFSWGWRRVASRPAGPRASWATLHRVSIINGGCEGRCAKPAPLPGRPGGVVRAAGRGVRLVSDAAAAVFCRGGSGCWQPRQHTPPPAAFLGRRSFPSSLPKTSDGKIVRQLLASIKKKKKKTAAPYISSLVTLR